MDANTPLGGLIERILPGHAKDFIVQAIPAPPGENVFTVGDQAAIKRLRRKGAVYEIHSDNQSVRPDSEPADAVHIVGRVVFVGARK